MSRPVYQTADLHEIDVGDACYTNTGEETVFIPSEAYKLFKFRINALKDSRARLQARFEKIESSYNGYKDLIETIDRAIAEEQERTVVVS